METFTYKNYQNCYFTVGSYVADTTAMAISIVNDEDGLISTCTIYDEFGFYASNSITVKNYSENFKPFQKMRSMKIYKILQNFRKLSTCYLLLKKL